MISSGLALLSVADVVSLNISFEVTIVLISDPFDWVLGLWVILN